LAKKHELSELFLSRSEPLDALANSGVGALVAPGGAESPNDLHQGEHKSSAHLQRLSELLVERVERTIGEIGIVHPSLPVGILRGGLCGRISKLRTAIAEYDEAYPKEAISPLTFDEYSVRSERLREAGREISEICTQAITLTEKLITPHGTESSAIESGKESLKILFSLVAQEVQQLNDQVVWRFRPTEGYTPVAGDQVHENKRALVFLDLPAALNKPGVSAYVASVFERNRDGLESARKSKYPVFIDAARQVIHRGPGAYLDDQNHYQENNDLFTGNRIFKISDEGVLERGEIVARDRGLSFILLCTNGVPSRIETIPDSLIREKRGLAGAGIFHAPPLGPETLLQERVLARLPSIDEALGQTIQNGAADESLQKTASALQESAPPLPGLEALCRTIRSAEFPIFVRVCGDLRDRNFDGPLEPRWIRNVDGLLLQGGDVLALANCCWMTTDRKPDLEEFTEAIAKGRYPLINRDTARYTDGIEAYFTGRKEIFGEGGRSHPMHPTRLGQLTQISHPSVPKSERLTVG
jgi:hypothetical protein